MNFRFLFFFIFSHFFSNSILSYNLDTNNVKKGRVVLVSSSMSLGLGASYIYVKNSWWNDDVRDFHFSKSNDFVYALNVDKAAHFLGGVASSEIFSRSFKWTGLNQERSIWYGALYGMSIQLAIELKDAYAPSWGFSRWDLAAGSIGSFWPVAQYYSESADAINFKFSYFKRSDISWDLNSQRDRDNKFVWIDDYPNQTYWASFDLDHFIDTDIIPSWLDLAIGFGLDDTQYLDNSLTKLGGNQEYYIALDYDIMEILKNWDTSFAKKFKHLFKYIKLPAPTIRIAPDLKVYPFFM